MADTPLDDDDSKNPNLAPKNALGLMDDWGGKMAAIQDCVDVDALLASDDVEFGRLLYILQTLERAETFEDLMVKQLALTNEDLNNLNSPLADLIRKCADLYSIYSVGFNYVSVLPFVYDPTFLLPTVAKNLAHLHFFVRRLGIYKDEVAQILFQIACERLDAKLFQFIKSNQLVLGPDTRHNILYTRIIGLYITDALRDLLAAEGYKEDSLFVASMLRGTLSLMKPSSDEEYFVSR